MRTPLGRVRPVLLVLVGILVAAIIVGLIVPGRTGTIIEAAAWIVLAVGIILEVGIRTTPLGRINGNDRRRGPGL